MIPLSLLLLMSSLSVANFKDYSTKKPNIIIILVDDLGWSDVSFHGSDQIPTPNIDALAYSGIILNRHYVLPTCTPSRTALLTGSYPIRHGMQGYPMKAGEARGVPLEAKLLPQYLKDLGYENHMVGKWHLGYMTPDYLPHHRGFDSFFGYYNGYTEYFEYGLNQSLTLNNAKEHFYGFDLHFNDKAYWKGKGHYATRLFTDQAVNIINDHNKNNPLFMYISHLAVHTGSSEGLGLELPDDIDVNKTFPYIKDYPRRRFAGIVQELDKSVGRVVEALKNAHMLENSILLLMADNGAQPVSVDMQPNYGSNQPLRGAKFTMYEGGVRGSALIWSPYLLKGVVSDQFLHISDWLPTLYHAAGGNSEDITDIDGVDQWYALKNYLNIQRDFILLNIDEKEKTEGVIIGNRWKLVKGGIMNYGNYDLHSGRESNTKRPPHYNIATVTRSQAGRSILSIPGYENALDPSLVEALRKDATVVCKGLKSSSKMIHNNFGQVNGSYKFFCPKNKYCLFDIIKDPCELNDIKYDEAMDLGKTILNSYKMQVVPQTNGPVDPKSDPDLWRGVWTPWVLDSEKSRSSKVIGSMIFAILCLMFNLLVFAKHCS